MGLLGLAIYRYAASKEERFRTRMLAFFKTFSLPWFAILGAHKSLDAGLGVVSAILIGLIATTAGGVLIDLFCGVTPEIVMPNQQIVSTAILAGGVYSLIAIHESGGESKFPVTLIAFGVSFIFRFLAVREHWSSIVPHNPPTCPVSSPDV